MTKSDWQDLINKVSHVHITQVFPWGIDSFKVCGEVLETGEYFEFIVDEKTIEEPY